MVSVEEFIIFIFRGVELLEVYYNMLQYQFKLRVKLFYIFGQLEKVKFFFNIEDYLVFQIILDQVRDF